MGVTLEKPDESVAEPMQSLAEIDRVEAIAAAPTGIVTDVQPEITKRRRSRVPRVMPWWVRLHRWVALALGIVILLECVSGAVLLAKPEIERWSHPARWQTTGSAQPMPASEAIAVVRREHPELDAANAYAFNGVWTVSGDGQLTAFVDPGSGRINSIAEPDSWFLELMAQVHDCFFTCEGLPAYLPLLNEQMPIPGTTDFTVAYFLLGLAALALAFLALSGLITWWPALRKWGTAFRVRMNRGSYARDLDLHKLIGILAVPLLFMWGVTGMNYVGFEWPSKVFYALVPGDAPDYDHPITAAPAQRAGKLVTPVEAENAALAAFPRGHVVALRSYGPADKDGSYLVNVGTSPDTTIDRISQDLGETKYVSVDSHTGSVTYTEPFTGVQNFWEQTFSTLHTGANLPWLLRFALEITSALAVVPLAITGITVWLTRWRSRRARRKRKRLLVRAAT